MQVPSSEEAAAQNPEDPEVSVAANSTVEDEEADATADDESSVIDISRRNLDFLIPESSEDAAALYLYKNVFNLLPKSIGSHKRLRTLRFFGNEINLFSPLASSEFGSFVGLECLQVRISSPEFGGLPLNKLKGLKELELSKGPPRPSACRIFSEIAGLKCLTKLSVSYFCISYLPVEIGCLNNLEYLDLSFNMMKSLPAELGNLSSLISLKVANNLLVVLPSTLSSLQRLEVLDLSYNRLTSLGSLELDLMHNLQILNLQHNQILTFCQIPSWICCNLEGNEKDTLNDDFSSSSVEMDVYVTPIQESEVSISRRGFHHSSSSQVNGHSSNNRCCAARRTGRYRKQGNNLQQRARQERLNSSRKWKGLDPSKLLHVKKDEECKPGNTDLLVTESYPECASDIINVDDDGSDKELISRELESGNVHEDVRPDVSLKEVYVGNCSSFSLESSTIEKGDEKGLGEFDASSATSQEVSSKEDESSSSNISKVTSNPKRHFDGDGDNWRHPKCRRFRPDSSNLSRRYSEFSVCSMNDHLLDGFYDAGRDRPFMPLEVYEQNFHLDSREVIVVDRQWDKELDTILRSAKDLVSCLNTHGNKADELQIASMLALFVSDHFGGSDRSALVEWARKANPLSDYEKPFVCTCPIQNSLSTKPIAKIVEDVVFSDLCDKSLRSIKERQNSIVVPIGTLQFGVCRHRALLLKYLCDWVEPRVSCELVRGYLDFMPHAWNVILIKRDGKEIRMVVDACRPRDIREEANPEYYCRYIPLSRTKVSIPIGSIPTSSFPSTSSCGETLKKPVTSLIRRKYGSNDAAGKMRTLVALGSSVDEIRNFDYSCLGEIRILSALKHPYVVQMYGHEILSKWVSCVDGSHEHRILQSIIWMEDIKGGSLQSYIKKLSKAGEKHVPVQLALCIAKYVACALVELHSKHIIHRDVKSENILIDLDSKTANGTPVVKLCDFDRAVPLRSYLHTCCIRHMGIPHRDICVGTPGWMAPEVLRAMHEPNIYGLEVDIWSFGCLLLELLTLQIPYAGLPHLEIHELLAMGKRPKLTDELEAFRSVNEPVMTQAGSELEGTEADIETLKFLVDLFYQCTEENPENRPTADNLYELLLNYRNTPTTSRTKKY